MKRKFRHSLSALCMVIILCMQFMILPVSAADVLPANPLENAVSTKSTIAVNNEETAETFIVVCEGNDITEPLYIITPSEIYDLRGDSRVLNVKIAINTKTCNRALELLTQPTTTTLLESTSPTFTVVPDPNIDIGVLLSDWQYSVSGVKDWLSSMSDMSVFEKFSTLNEIISPTLADGKDIVRRCAERASDSAYSVEVTQEANAISHFVSDKLAELEAATSIALTGGGNYTVIIGTMGSAGVVGAGAGVAAVICWVAVKINGEDALSDSVEEIRAMRICDIT